MKELCQEVGKYFTVDLIPKVLTDLLVSRSSKGGYFSAIHFLKFYYKRDRLEDFTIKL